MKKCSKCGRILPLESFKSRNGRPYYICKECEKEYMTQYRKKNRAAINKQHREYMREYSVSHQEEMSAYARNYARERLGISPENFRGPNDGRYINNKKGKAYLYNIKYSYGLTKEEYEKLPKFCEVCGSTERLCIDHDHSTGRVRGILCARCNIALGMLRDNPVYIDKLKEYLINSLPDN